MELNTVNMTTSEIDNLKISKEKELREAQKSLYEVELKELEISKEIVNLQSQKKDFQIAASKARYIVRTLSLDIKILVGEFWRSRDNR